MALRGTRSGRLARVVEGSRPKTQQERQADRRQAKLDEVQRQIDSGSLNVRQMTPEELEKNQPRPPREKKPKR